MIYNFDEFYCKRKILIGALIECFLTIFCYFLHGYLDVVILKYCFLFLAFTFALLTMYSAFSFKGRVEKFRNLKVSIDDRELVFLGFGKDVRYELSQLTFCNFGKNKVVFKDCFNNKIKIEGIIEIERFKDCVRAIFSGR